MDKDSLKLAILDNATDFLCLVQDKNRNIVFPENSNDLSKFKQIDDSPTQIDGVYYVESTHEWYEKEEKIIQLNGQLYYLIYYKDITKFKVLEHVLRSDYTTGIANRATAINEINQYIKYALENDEEFSVLISDVDFFKGINDTYGHLFGDIVLKNIGELIKKNIRSRSDREKDIAGRFGGDEFFGLIKNITQEETDAWVERANEKVKGLIHESIDGKVKVTDIGMSIGAFHVSHEMIATFKTMPLSVTEIRKHLFLKCDEKLYEIKDKNHAKILDGNIEDIEGKKLS